MAYIAYPTAAQLQVMNVNTSDDILNDFVITDTNGTITWRASPTAADLGGTGGQQSVPIVG